MSNKIVLDNKVHETDSSRQYIRLPLLAHIEIDSITYNISNLSSGGLSIKNFPKTTLGKVINVKLILPFNNFSMDLNLSIEAAHISGESIGFKFINLNKEKISTINHVISSYISGDVLKSEDVLNIMSRENFVNMRKNNKSITIEEGKKTSRISRMLSYYIIYAVGLFAALFIIVNIVESVFVLESNYAYVNASTITINSKFNGVYKNLLSKNIKEVKKGDVIAQVISNKKTMYVVSPCDCYIINRGIRSGDHIPKNYNIFTLMPIGNSLWVTVLIKPENIDRVNIGDSVFITIAGQDNKVRGRVQSISIKHRNGRNSIYMYDGEIRDAVFIDVALSQAVSPNFVGRPAKALFLFFDFIKQKEA